MKVLCVVGTRPEAIKMAPVIAELKSRNFFRTEVLAAGQHKELLHQTLELFSIEADASLNVMRPQQDLNTLTVRLIEGIDSQLRAIDPDLVIAQGDTTTVFSTALACFHRQTDFGHVEAGLRTGDIRSPFPEEFNRVACSSLASLHFAPTSSAASNLIAEGISESNILVSGNTVIDALFHMRNAVDKSFVSDSAGATDSQMILVTAHRRENFGEPFANICGALLKLLKAHPKIKIVWPLHPNPSAKRYPEQILSQHPRVKLCDPLNYRELVEHMMLAKLVLTDSGGIQEEAPALAKPVLVMRNETERPEAIEAGVAKLVGTEQDSIFSAANSLLSDPQEYKKMSIGGSPYGDGHASKRIVDFLYDRYQ